MARVTTFAGDYDAVNRPELRKKLDRLVFAPDVVLNFTVTFVDSTFIAELLRLDDLRGVNELDRMTVLVDSDGPICRLFEVLGLSERFRVEPRYGTYGSNRRSIAPAFSGRGTVSST